MVIYRGICFITFAPGEIKHWYDWHIIGLLDFHRTQNITISSSLVNNIRFNLVVMLV